MSIQTHLAALKRRHQVLEQQINKEQLHPSCDDLKIAELKRRELLVRDEIADLQQGSAALAAPAKLSAAEKRRAVLRTARRKSNSWYEGATRSIAIVKDKQL
jgi:hypothetical protein